MLPRAWGRACSRAPAPTLGPHPNPLQPPEVLQRRPYDEKADIFGFGVLLYELFMRRSLIHYFESQDKIVRTAAPDYAKQARGAPAGGGMSGPRGKSSALLLRWWATGAAGAGRRLLHSAGSAKYNPGPPPPPTAPRCSRSPAIGGTPPLHKQTPALPPTQVEGGYRMPLADKLPTQLKRLIEACMAGDPAERPSISAALVVLAAVEEGGQLKRTEVALPGCACAVM